MFTPVAAIRKFCLWHNCSSKEVKLCPKVECPLYNYRLRKRNAGSNPALTPIKAIRAWCLGCSESMKEVATCSFPDCSLYPYRFGKRPQAATKTSQLPATSQQKSTTLAALPNPATSPQQFTTPQPLTNKQQPNSPSNHAQSATSAEKGGENI
ncbi:MAG: hypothetical protein A2252_05880 [Elusimicrobia bacterium RIFOXYA2_FULL_39_19]|nr:MAG: hypothetical protein A2252_05880 [Elusimicrobia bacterium RIFOXYA2_FULL_39_19]